MPKSRPSRKPYEKPAIRELSRAEVAELQRQEDMKMEESRRGELLGRRKETLLVHLNMITLEERKASLVEATELREASETALRREKDEAKARKEELEADVMAAASACFRLARVIKTREEQAEVDVEDHIDGSTVYSVRMDTGEVIATRKASEGELQRSLIS